MNEEEQITLQSVLTNNQLDIRKFFEQSFYNGVPLCRFVDDMVHVDWDEIGRNIGRAPLECKSHYQHMLDQLFGKDLFSKEDRELLYRIITGPRKFRLGEQDGDRKIYKLIPEDTLKSLQTNYFPDYSTEVIMIELIAVLENFKLFIEENHKQ